MRMMLTAAILAANLGGAAQAQTTYGHDHVTCTDYGTGVGTCRDSNGRTSTTYTDTMGNVTVHDSDGHTTRIQRDAFGAGVTIRGEDGSTVRAQTDMFGNTTFRDEAGNQTRCHRSPVAPPGQSEMDCD